MYQDALCMKNVSSFFFFYWHIYLFISCLFNCFIRQISDGKWKERDDNIRPQVRIKPWAGHSLGTKAFSWVFNLDFHTCIETCRECFRLLHPLPLLMVSDAYNNSNLLCLLRLLCCSDHKNNQIKSTSVTSFSFSLSFSHCHRSNVCVCAALHTHSQVCCQLVSEILWLDFK